MCELFRRVVNLDDSWVRRVSMSWSAVRQIWATVVVDVFDVIMIPGW